MVYIAADGSVGGNKSLWTRITDFFRGMSKSLCDPCVASNDIFSIYLMITFSNGLVSFRQRFFCSFHYSFQQSRIQKVYSKNQQQAE